MLVVVVVVVVRHGVTARGARIGRLGGGWCRGLGRVMSDQRPTFVELVTETSDKQVLLVQFGFELVDKLVALFDLLDLLAQTQLEFTQARH